MRWAVVCSVPDERIINTLSEFATWFLEEVTVVAGRMNIYARFEKRPKVVQHVPVGDYDACATAYETIRKGVLLENALDRFASVAKMGNDASEVFANVAQWIARATSKLCLDKDPFFMTIAMSSIISSMLLPLMKEEMRLAPWIAMDLRQEVEPVKELERWARQMDLAMFSKTFFYEVFSWTKPAIETVYRAHQRFVVSMVKRSYEEGEGLHLAADGAYDSRGYSAMIGKVVLSDLRTKLVLHTGVLHRSETENISTRMEIEGIRRLMRWVVGCGLRVSSLTTDRSRALGAVLKDLEPELGSIRHYYDGWHLVKWLGNELRKTSKKTDCGMIDAWTEKVKTHLWTAIEYGAKLGADVRAMFNTCLMHITGAHRWPRNELTGPYVGCSHEPMGPRPQDLSAGSTAYKRFREVVLTESFQRDLVKASPYGGTSICEAKNALDRIYCRKEIFYPIATYPLYTMMATMHINTLRLAEMSGERVEVRRRKIKRKYLNRYSVLVVKSQPKHLWRDLVLKEVLKERLVALEAKRQRASPLWVADLMDAEEEYDFEL